MKNDPDKSIAGTTACTRSYSNVKYSDLVEQVEDCSTIDESSTDAANGLKGRPFQLGLLFH